MQADRLFGIVYLLLERRQVTAKELAERFTVSRRTIFRDIEALSMAGVPLYTQKGKGGGIRLMERYVLDKSLLTPREQVDILAAIEGLRAARYPDAQAVQEKLSALFHAPASRWIAVDFSDWSGLESGTFELLQNAILQKRTVTFDYYSGKGERSRREAEPLQLYFRHKAWYLAAFCCVRQQPRLFKLTRIRNLHVTEYPVAHTLEDVDFAPDTDPAGGRIVEVELWLDESLAYRVYDEFAPEFVQKRQDGGMVARVRCPQDAWLCGYLLSFGAQARVISPPYIREMMAAECRRILALYE